jgi:ribosomal protein S1
MKFAGHMVAARVVEVDKRKITLDAGAKIAKIAVADITPEAILSRAPPAAGEPARGAGEVRPGDVVQVYLEHEETPEGDMMVSGQQAAVKRRVKAVWKELAERQAAGKTVRGRVLNSVAGGYAVGVAGLVCFLPGSNCSRATGGRIGDLQEFRVVGMTRERNNVVLADVRADAELQRAAAGGGGHQGWRQHRLQKRGAAAAAAPRPVVREAEGMRRDLDRTRAPAPAGTGSAAAAAAPAEGAP